MRFQTHLDGLDIKTGDIEKPKPEKIPDLVIDSRAQERTTQVCKGTETGR